MTPLHSSSLCALGRSVALLSLAMLFGCGGGGGGDSGGEDAGSVYFDAPLLASASLQGGSCTDLRQKQFVRSYLDEVYLWPEQVQRRDAKAYADVHDYFQAIKAATPLDRFSFSSTTQAADNRENSLDFDVGIYWVNVGGEAARVWRIARVEAGSPADLAGLQRGDTLVGTVQTNLNSSTSGPYFYRFAYRRSTELLQANLVPVTVTEHPVGALTTVRHNNRLVAYLPFESHYGAAQDQLMDAIGQARTAGVQDLVLDLRYNSGGFLYIAASLASMLAPKATVDTQPTLVRLQPNNKLQSLYADAVVRMAPTVQYVQPDFRNGVGSVLPNLNLSRVYVLSGPATCSASESLINGLRGIGVTVHIVGDTTCGKPYGMVRKDNCGAAFYPIQYRGVNALGQADFSSGIAPTCRVADDLDHPRGSADEGLLAAALHHIDTGNCPTSLQGTSRGADLAQMAPRPLGQSGAPPQRPRPGLALLDPQ